MASTCDFSGFWGNWAVVEEGSWVESVVEVTPGGWHRVARGCTQNFLRFYKAEKVLTQSIAQMCKKTGGGHKLETTLNLTVGGALGSVFGV